MVGRRSIARLCPHPLPGPAALPAALVPGARRHVCRSISLSGLPGSHYFTSPIIYSSTEPSACGWALTLTSLTAGEEPHSGHINHQPRRWGACVLRGKRSCCRHTGPVSTPISHGGIHRLAWHDPMNFSIWAGWETEAWGRAGLAQESPSPGSITWDCLRLQTRSDNNFIYRGRVLWLLSLLLCGAGNSPSRSIRAFNQKGR